MPCAGAPSARPRPRPRQARGPGASASRQRLSAPSSRPVTGSSASSRQPSRSTQSASGATTADAAIPTDVSSMQPRNVRNPRSRARSSIRRAGPMPPHFASLTLTPATTPTSAVEVVDRHGALVGDQRQRRPGLERPQVVEAARRERLLDELHAEALQLREQVHGLVGRPAGVGVDADRPVEHGPHRADRREVRRSADLDLERREVRRPARALGDDRRLVDAQREVGRRDDAVDAEQRRAPGRPSRLPTRSWSAMSIAHLAAPLWPMAAAIRSAASSRAASASARSPAQPVRDGLDRLEQDREDHGRHGARRLAVERVRVALAEADRAAGAVGVVAELDEHRRRGAALAVRRARDHERVAQRQDERRERWREGHAGALRRAGRRPAPRGRPRAARRRRLDRPATAPRRRNARGRRTAARSRPPSPRSPGAPRRRRRSARC